ncbi:DCL family protein [Pseudomonas sp. 148P]|uniref:DCL family protein n=1 Tax=Pseudomonas ulcerans TaxID=3115852 RepID=A0ABU7HNM5_9PSED|nr:MULTISPECIES: DCL family protein [unclassified Pseudomonas]MEE1923631.1 DCL family protein [Pseudomonas sp. 147P]MEE1933129.1 DCL family protein [Pseudomonas sp. 148P]
MYWLGPFEYPSKQALLDRLKHFIRSADLGQINHPVAVQKLHLLLALHPEADRKIGVGVDHFRLERNQLAGRGLRLVRFDGTSDSFSYKRCITGVTQSHHGKVCEALRFAVRPQMEAFRESLEWPVKCAIKGVEIAHPNDLHIDHKVAFWRLLEQFCSEHEIELPNLQVVGNGMTLALANRQVTEAFIEYHHHHAQLQPTCREANVWKGGRLQIATE